MAQPITTIPSTRVSSEQIQERIEAARLANAAAILSAYELLRQLHEAGVLDLLRGALGAGNTLVTKLAMASNAPESINAVRNLVSIGRILGSVDPDVLHALADELTSPPARQKSPPPSLWRALRALTGKETRHALAASLGFVQAFGRALLAGNGKR
jgi:uncharacterized protein YjgD (DUF1641 family)